MKFTAILLLAVGLQVSAKTHAQMITLSKKNVPIEQVFFEIKIQSGFVFFYNYDLLKNVKPVTIEAKNASIEEVLTILFKNQSLNFSIEDKTVFITKKQTIAELPANNPPSFEVKGKITNDKGEPLAGVSVQEKGTSNGTITNDNGTFSLKITNTNSVLVISNVGFTAQEIFVRGNSMLSLHMIEEPTSMNDVIVVGYGTTSKKNLTTAISKVDPKSIPQAANNSVAQLLFGRAPGLQAVQQSSEPGGNITLSIRGRGDPLIVIDGVVMPYSGLEPSNGSIGGELNGVHRGGFAGLNPDDIESIEILKDASAAIYGVNAGNGVILITTKKGKSGRINVSYTGSESVVKNMPYFKPLNASDYESYYNHLTLDQYLINNKMTPFGTNAPTGFVPLYSNAQIQSAGTGTNWLNQVLRDGRIDNHSIAVSGGTDKVVYYFSGNYFNQVGTVKNSGLQKYTGRMNLSFNLNKFLTLNTGVIASRNNFANSTAGWQNGGSGEQGFGALQAALAYPSNVPIRDSSGKYSLFGITGNPASLLDIKDQTIYNSLIANISLDVKIIPNVLTGKILYGNNSENATRSFFIPSTAFYFQQYRTRGSYNEASRQNQTMEATLSFKKKLNSFLNVDAVAGVGQYISDDYGFGAQGADMLDAIGVSNLASATGNIAISSYKNYNKTRSYFARGNFDFFDKYVLSLVERYDGYSNFFPQSKYAGFPSASVAWKISNEAFLKNLKAINLLKLRASIGTTGIVQGTVAYGAYNPDTYSISFNKGAVTYIPYLQVATDHPGLTWLKTVNKDIGLDFSFAKDRISGSIDWFKDNLTNILGVANTDPLSFIPTEPVNGGHQVRKGYELGLNTTNIRTKNFQWSTIINVSHFDYRWSQQFPNADIPNYAHETDPVDAIYVYRTKGILQIGQTAPSWQPAAANFPGSPIFVDVNGDKKLDSADVVMYNADPKITIGFGNNFRYKNFDLLIFFYGQFGGRNYNYNTIWSDPANLIAGYQSGIQETKNIWTTSNPNGTLPGVAYNQYALGLPTGVNTRLTSTNFVRCRNITLGYTFNSVKLNNYIKNLRLYVDVQNAFIISNFKVGDPEVQAQIVKGGPAPYPMARTYSVGVKTNF